MKINNVSNVLAKLEKEQLIEAKNIRKGEKTRTEINELENTHTIAKNPNKVKIVSLKEQT